MSVQAIAAIVTCLIATGSILIYVGKSLQTLNQISTNQTDMAKRLVHHDNEIARLDKEVTEVKTRQADCTKCP